MRRVGAALHPNLPPRGLSREAASEYVGVSASKFDMLVADGRMPKAVAVDGRRVWDRLALDRAFDQLAGVAVGERNEWDAA